MERRRPWKTLTLPEHLCESDDPVKMAKAYTLQLLTLADQLGGSEMVKELSSWTEKLKPEELERSRLEYEETQKLASSVIPFIRTDLKRLLDEHKCGYKKNCIVKSSVNPDVKSSVNPPEIPVEMDGFLFEDLEEALENQGLPSDRICSRCKSSQISELEVKYKSSSVESMVNLFHVALKDTKFDSVCVISSGEGALVYGSFILTNSSRIVSYESDEVLLNLQRTIVKSYEMESRVQVKKLDQVLSDDTLDTAELVILSSDHLKDSVNIVKLEEKLKVGVEKGKMIVIYSRNSKTEKVLPILKDLPKIQAVFSTQEFCICRV